MNGIQNENRKALHEKRECCSMLPFNGNLVLFSLKYKPTPVTHTHIHTNANSIHAIYTTKNESAYSFHRTHKENPRNNLKITQFSTQKSYRLIYPTILHACGTFFEWCACLTTHSSTVLRLASKWR